MTWEGGGGGGNITKHASILRREAYLGFYVGECHMLQKYWWWANQMDPSEKKKPMGSP